MNLDLSSILNSITSQNVNIADATRATVEFGAQSQQTREEIGANIRKTGELAALEEQTSGLGELKAQQNSRKAATALGTNMDMSNEIITALGMRMRDSSLAALSTLDQIKAKESVGLLDNPIEFLMNQLSVGDDYDNYNMAVEEYNQASSALQGINAATQQTAVTQNAIAEKVTEASIAAKVEKTRLIASTMAAENKIKGFAEGQENLLRTVSLGGQQLQNHLAARQVFQDERNFQMRQQEFAASQKAQALQLAKMEKELKKDALEEQDMEMITQSINVTRAQASLSSVTSREVSRILKMGGQVAEDLRSQYLIGASALVTGSPILATQPSEALSFLGRNKGKLGSSVMDGFLKSLPNSTADSMKKGEYLELKPTERAEAIDSFARRKAGLDQLELIKGDTLNLYKLPPASTVLETVALKNSTLSAILAPVMETSQNKDIEPDRLVSLAAEALKKRTVRFETIAAELDTYFAQAKSINNDYNKYEQIGLPPQQQINVRVGGKLYDLSDPAKLRLALMRQGNSGLATRMGVASSTASIFGVPGDPGFGVDSKQ